MRLRVRVRSLHVRPAGDAHRTGVLPRRPEASVVRADRASRVGGRALRRPGQGLRGGLQGAPRGRPLRRRPRLLSGRGDVPVHNRQAAARRVASCGDPVEAEVRGHHRGLPAEGPGESRLVRGRGARHSNVPHLGGARCFEVQERGVHEKLPGPLGSEARVGAQGAESRHLRGQQAEGFYPRGLPLVTREGCPAKVFILRAFDILPLMFSTFRKSGCTTRTSAS
mmetsp:Transcript_2306/g.7758  ORF Transcript_2306/g.7758 Transcript_2306/m.7758 type:complete len:224 (+) Transcript_2306:241-912(+)